MSLEDKKNGEQETVSTTDSTTSQKGRPKVQWGALLHPNAADSNEFGEEASGSNEADDRDDANSVESASTGDGDQNPDVAFGLVHSKVDRIWLDSYGFSQEQLYEIESNPILGTEMSWGLITLAQEQSKIKREYETLKREKIALNIILAKELGYNEKTIKARVADTLKLSNTLNGSVPRTGKVDQMVSGPTISGQSHLAAMINVTGEKALRITAISPESMREFADYLRRAVARNVDDNRAGILSTDAVKALHRSFMGKLPDRVPITAKAEHWLALPAEKLADLVEAAYPHHNATSALDWNESFIELFVELDVRDENSYTTYLNEIGFIESNATNQGTLQIEVVKNLATGLTKVPRSKSGMHVTRCNIAMQSEIRKLIAAKDLDSIERYIVCFHAIVTRARDGLEKFSVWDNSEGGRKRKTELPLLPAPKKIKTPADPTVRLKCFGCNRDLPTTVKVATNVCKNCAGHPDRNVSGPWMGSSIQKELSAHSFTAIHSLRRANGTPLTTSQLEAMAEARKSVQSETSTAPTQQNNNKPSNKRFGKPGNNKGELNTTSSIPDRQHDGLVTAQLTIDTNLTESVFIQVLLDTGAKDANYISKKVADSINSLGSNNSCKLPLNISSSTRRISLGGTDKYLSSSGVIACNFTFFNELNNNFEKHNCLEFIIIDSAYDCIIGHPTIIKLKLASKIPSFFSGQEEDSCTSAPVHLDNETVRCACAHSSSLSSIRSICGTCGEEDMNNESFQILACPKVKNESELSALCLAAIASKNDLLGESLVDDDEIQWKDDPFDAIAPKNEQKGLLQKISVHGSPELQNNIRKLCDEFKDIFSEYVRTEPARIPPMEIQVDETKWFINKNRLPPRPQTEARQQAIQKHIGLYKELHVIEESNASAHSQVHLVPKPSDPLNPEWRFCLDFVRLNEATVGTENWPIPNIPQMIQRIGTKKPKVFGVMDMTSGYHQAPLSPTARLLTAFICFAGLFHWLRVPMGLKNAAAYFQKMMATVVLSGIIYVMCELYIDDVFVFGKDETEFLENLRHVFERMRKYNITLNPKKVCLGQDHIEFVGHVVNADGISFSGEKRDKVLNFPLPIKVKQLMGFIGLVNYFRDHVSDMTNKLKALRELTTDRKKPVQWSDETERLFYSVRDEVANCPTLFFLDANAEVFVLTDASDYGIGAYIYQMVDDKQQPVIFLSKALSGAQLNWSTIEKEAYAIFFTLKTYEYLLKDIKFTLRTDHKNLTYLSLEGSQKVRRWRLFIQEFNFQVEHIAGEDNIVADAFSRLCTREEATEVFTLSALSSLVDGPSTATNKGKLRLEKIDKVNIPDDCYRKIRQVHNRTVGHSGVEQTIAKLAEAGHTWRNMRLHVQSFVRKCDYCQANSEKKISVKVAPFTRASYHPMEVLNVDTIGPLPKDDSGNEYILVIIDCFSRWVELYAIPDTSAKSAAEPLLQHCGRFGVPALIRSDRGTQFVNALIEQLSELLLTDQELTTAYSKELNAIVERANKEVMRHLRAMVYDDRVFMFWSTRQLPLVMRILNSEEKTRTGISPAEMLFGNAVDLGRYLLHRPKQTPNPDRDLNEHLQKMLEAQSTLIKVAQETQMEFDTHHMSRNDPELSDFPINSYVLWDNPAGGRNKMQTKLQGPYQVVARQGDDIIIQDLIQHKDVITHISNVREFLFDSNRTDPKEIAMHSSQEFVIESILEHEFTGNIHRRSTLRFKVRWQGYPPEHDTWEPYSYLRDTEQLHAYLNANKMKSYIPAKFK